MKVAKYIVEVCNSTVDFVHGFKYPIVEYWIPDYRLCFNLVDGVVNVFEWSKPRSDKHELVEMSDELVSVVKSFFEMKTKLEEMMKEIIWD